MGNGKVYLVGAGPGDEELITVKGLAAIKEAEVILYDRLVNPRLLEFASSECELVYCGKLPHRHFLKQELINDLLIEKALKGKNVVRLKGGDPGVFGRVGEEALALADHNIEFEMIPGITSGLAAPLYAGIPVTHRDYGGSFSIVTAHDKSIDGRPSIDWEGLIRGNETIAFYMGIANLEHICENLMKNGKSPETPIILIQWGTWGRQKTLEGTLATIVGLAEMQRFRNPAITLVGEIIKIREKISWFEKKPLFGRQVLLIRTGTDESDLAKELRGQGADVVEFPKWRKRSVEIDQLILKQIDTYDRILFTSSESVEEFFEILYKNKIDIRKIKGELYGKSTKSKKAIERYGVFSKVESDMGDEGKLLIIGDRNDMRPIDNQKADFLITSIKETDENFISISKRTFEEATFDTIILPSSFSVNTFLGNLEKIEIDQEEFLKSVRIICMGKNTWKTAESFGLLPNDMPDFPSNKELIKCLINKETYSYI
ncbi:uroporphyrinogen-III C-methyltransferase [Metabacillus herbersteinensis]|uniref:uroporphyrinogen-III C-methyltransferase n=1 Tax=Metabacillus herbersteinensis TaxID=283816 RepID=A0ABV6GER7_9BACI